MATIVMERLGHLFINLQQVRQVAQVLREAVPSIPGTLRASEVPAFFREPYIHSGYRAPDLAWRYYFLSLFQRHNETVNVWTHLLGALLILATSLRLAETVDFAGDAHAWPLLLLLGSGFTYMLFSVAAHLLSARSPLHHHALYFLDYAGVALYQYASAAVHFHYAAEPGWRGGAQWASLALAALLSLVFCLGGCCTKLGGPLWARGVWQLLPCALAYAWDSAPIFHRLSTCLPTCADDEAGRYHGAQVALFLLSAVFFTWPVPERWFPGRCDLLPQGHQVFHVLVVLCTFSQIRASHLDYLQRRALYAPAGPQAPRLLLGLFAALALSCAITTILMTRRAQHLIGQKHKGS
ncbi:membrane progestin receptor alpha-B-like [Anguilla rostrata]|uniref:membrane progestin receptor alpha-B-like n=1 Tax=Anguilla rostrata TaxID=7938 RepID=UPI0030D292B0